MNPSSKNFIVPFDEMELMKWMVDRFRGANRGVAVPDSAAYLKPRGGLHREISMFPSQSSRIRAI